MPEIEITVYDVNGRVVQYSKCEADTATEEEVAAAVKLIEQGWPAWLAIAHVKASPPAL